MLDHVGFIHLVRYPIKENIRPNFLSGMTTMDLEPRGVSGLSNLFHWDENGLT